MGAQHVYMVLTSGDGIAVACNDDPEHGRMDADVCGHSWWSCSGCVCMSIPDGWANRARYAWRVCGACMMLFWWMGQWRVRQGTPKMDAS